MSARRLYAYVEHIHQAATDILSFIEGLSKDDFVADKRTQKAVIMCLVIIGEAASKVMDHYANFVERNSRVPWRGMRGTRNRIAHGYFDINLDVVWDTTQTAVPELLAQFPGLLRRAEVYEQALGPPSDDDAASKP
jgi:uncharacterized protein with HEPN domain